jgi:hypothetical protein
LDDLGVNPHVHLHLSNTSKEELTDEDYTKRREDLEMASAAAQFFFGRWVMPALISVEMNGGMMNIQKYFN